MQSLDDNRCTREDSSSCAAECPQLCSTSQMQWPASHCESTIDQMHHCHSHCRCSPNRFEEHDQLNATPRRSSIAQHRWLLIEDEICHELQSCECDHRSRCWFGLESSSCLLLSSCFSLALHLLFDLLEHRCCTIAHGLESDELERMPIQIRVGESHAQLMKRLLVLLLQPVP